MISLSGKNIVVSGASSGIGRACALECSRTGASVHMLARNSASLREVEQKLDLGTHSVNILDVTSTNDIEPVISSIVDKYGRIDGFIHSAGIQEIQPFSSISRDQYLKVFAVNTIAAFDICRVLVKRRYCSKDGQSLLFISSVMSVAGDSGLTSYCASKAALVGGARAMAVELASRNIRVNCISPGSVVDTGITERLINNLSQYEYSRIESRYPGGIGRAEDVAKLSVFLLSSVARWITGQNIIIDGGYSVL